MFGRKNIFFEKSYDGYYKKNSADQTQQNYANTNGMREQLI